MDKLLRRFIPSLAEHLTDDRMAGLFCHELRFAERLIARQHLACCWHCRVRREDLEGRRAERMVDLYRDAMGGEALSLSDGPRTEFIQRLRVQMQSATPRRWWAFRLPHLPLPELSSMNPALAACMVLGLGTVVSFFLWWQQRLPDITSNALLVRAETWDAPSLSPGVVFQAVRITTPQQTMERSIYRDLQGKRQFKQVKLPIKEEQLKSALIQAGLDWDEPISAASYFQAVRITTPQQTMERSIYRDLQGKRQFKQVKLPIKEEQLKSALIQAGLDWDEPISAASYQGWHDRQRVREDKIVRAGKHLLTLTTKVPDGSIAEQSLTVRDTDFHPVRRTVAFRESGTVEIAELDFKILPWTALDASIVEPVIDVERSVIAAPTRVLPFPRLPERVTEGQMDEAELSARLILNQLHADTGEQIEIHRIPQGVEVAGLVDTEERKRTLQAQLQTVPHLTVSIQSVADLQARSGANENVTSIKTASMTNQPSPLETYLQIRGRSVSAINVLAERLFNDALTISQESRAIDDLQTRFLAGEKTVLASATLSELIYSHKERLQVALRQERELLAEARSVSGSEAGASAPIKFSPSEPVSLMDAAARNLALCKKLTQTNSPTAQSAEEILAEMSLSMEDLTAVLRNTHRKAQNESALGGKK